MRTRSRHTSPADHLASEPQQSGPVGTHTVLPPLDELENVKARELKELLNERGLETKGKMATLVTCGASRRFAWLQKRFAPVHARSCSRSSYVLWMGSEAVVLAATNGPESDIPTVRITPQHRV